MKRFRFFCVSFFLPVCLLFAGIDREAFLLGIKHAAMMEGTDAVPVEKDPRVKRVVDIIKRLSAVRPNSDAVFTVQLVKSDVPNAYALPGGFLFVTDRLLELDITDDELAFVLAHEMAHVLLKHHQRQQRESGKAAGIQAASMIAGFLLQALQYRQSDFEYNRMRSATGMENYGAINTEMPAFLATTMLGSTYATFAWLQSQQGFEKEADVEGARIAVEAGYSREGGEGMLKKLSFVGYQAPEMGDWRTHPMSQERLHIMRAAMKGLEPAYQNREEELVRVQESILERMIELYHSGKRWREGPDSAELACFLNRILLLGKGSRLEEQIRLIRVRDWMIPNNINEPLLVGDFGRLHSELDELRQRGSDIDLLLVREIKSRADKALGILLERENSGQQPRPWYQHMMRNWPEHERASEWKYMLWKTNPDSQRKVRATKEVRALPGVDEKDITAELTRLKQSKKLSPLTRVLLAGELDETLSEEEVRAMADSCESLQEIASLLLEFPEMGNGPAGKRLRELAELGFRKGRVLMMGRNPQAAIEAWSKVILFAPGSKYAQICKEEIYRLNTLGQE